MKDDTTEVNSSLRSLDVKQPSSHIAYNNILTVESSIYQELISFQMVRTLYSVTMVTEQIMVTVQTS